jgi:hypothetical protein
VLVQFEVGGLHAAFSLANSWRFLRFEHEDNVPLFERSDIKYTRCMH